MTMTAVDAVADLVQGTRPFVGQDAILKYRVRTNKTLRFDENITGWALQWRLFTSVDATTLLLSKTTASGITIATPYASVALSAAETAVLSELVEYGMQLWRNDAGNKYPLTGIGMLTPQPSPAEAI